MHPVCSHTLAHYCCPRSPKPWDHCRARTCGFFVRVISCPLRDFLFVRALIYHLRDILVNVGQEIARLKRVPGCDVGDTIRRIPTEQLIVAEEVSDHDLFVCILSAPPAKPLRCLFQGLHPPRNFLLKQRRRHFTLSLSVVYADAFWVLK